MRAALVGLALVAACGNHTNSGGDDGNMPGDDGHGGDDGSGGPGTVTVTLTNHPGNAASFTFIAAYQDGSSPWQAAPAPAGDVYTLPIHAPVWGFAWTCIGVAAGGNTGAQVRQVVEYHFSIVERTSLSITVPPRCSDHMGTGVSLHGTIANAQGGGQLVVRWGERATTVNGSGQWAMEVQPGTHDLIVLHQGFTASNGDTLVDEAVVQRGVTVSGPTTANTNFNDAQSVQFFGVAMPGILTGREGVSTTLYTAGGTTAPLVSDSFSPFETESLADAQMAAGDVYDQTMTVAGQGTGATTTNATATPLDETWVAPAPLGAVKSMTASGTYTTLATTWGAYASSVGYIWSATQTPTQQICPVGGCSIAWTALLSPGVLGAMPTFTMPDLSAIAGWSALFELETGTPVTTSVIATTSTAGATDFPQITPPAVGTERVFVRTDYTLTP